jgi:outer membrane receptor protein involved in Fe transport
MDGRVRLETVVYQYKYTDLQQVSYDPTTVSQLIRNAAEATAKGIEVNGDWRITPDWMLRAAIGYSDATFDKFNTAPCYIGQTAALGCVNRQQDLSGERLARAPEWSSLVGVSYDGQLTDSLRWSFAADAAYTSSYAASDNQNPIGDQDSFWLLGSAVRIIGGADEQWELALIGQNLTNEYYKSIAFDKSGGGPGQIATTVARARQVALQATFKF